MSKAYVPDLLDALERSENCEAAWVRTVGVTETHDGTLVWQGEVQIFRLSGHPDGVTCAYGWHSTTDEGQLKLTVVLHVPPVDSPEAAVRASIASDYRSGKA